MIGPRLPRTIDRNVPHALPASRRPPAPFIMRDGQRCYPSMPGVRAARYVGPLDADHYTPRIPGSLRHV